MANIKFIHSHEEKEVADGSPIASVCEEQGIPISCGSGICGACIVHIRKGMENLSEPTAEEIEFLGQKGVAHERMACQCSIASGTVEIEP